MARILCVANTAFFIYNYLLGVLKILKKDGPEIILVAPEDEYTDLLEAEGFRCITLKELDRKGANAIKDLKLMLELYNIYKMEKPDMVLHYTIKVNVYGTFAAKLAKTDSVCTVSGLGWLFTEKSIKTIIGGFFYKILYRIAFSIALNVVFQNRNDCAFFIENRLVDKDKVFLTPGPGVDTGHFSPEQCKDEGTNRENIIFLLMARMLWDKGIGEFARAARTVKINFPHTEFWLVGPIDKENRAAIPEDVIKDWESEGIIRYLGKTNDVRPFLYECDVAVLPSYREGTASSLIEAMAVGKPVITTDAVGCREVVEDGKNGFLVPVKDERALSDAIIKYILLPQEEKNKMGKYSREKAISEFDKKIVIDTYRTIIRNAAGHCM
jgi:glycosyltransferase involved in cell wall biosynthesis